MSTNKMFVMLPLMFAARKLDGEDPNIVFMLRCAYGSIQALILLAVLYTYMTAVKLSKSKIKDKEIFVPGPPQSFDPNAKKQYKKTTIGEHALSVAQKLIMSTIFGIMMTVGLHWYKGMIVGLAMQTVMGPLNLFENQFVKSVLLLGGGKGQDTKLKMFGEKSRDEVIADGDEVVDADGKILKMKKKDQKKTKTFEDFLLEAWDAGSEAILEPLISAFTKDNANFKTSEDGWTPLMIMTALNAKDSAAAIKALKKLGANATITDNEKWNPLHWAAFHGSTDGATALMEQYDVFGLGLHLAKDKSGKTPLDLANEEGNKMISDMLNEKSEASGIAEQVGMRKRK